MNKALIEDGDVGCGAPGSLLWHKCALRELTEAGKIDYIKEVFPAMSDEDKLDLTVYLIAEKSNEARRSSFTPNTSTWPDSVSTSLAFRISSP